MSNRKVLEHRKLARMEQVRHMQVHMELEHHKLAQRRIRRTTSCNRRRASSAGHRRTT